MGVIRDASFPFNEPFFLQLQLPILVYICSVALGLTVLLHFPIQFNVQRTLVISTRQLLDF